MKHAGMQPPVPRVPPPGDVPAVIHSVTSAGPGFEALFEALWDLRVPDSKLARQLQATTLPSAGMHVVFCYGDELGFSDNGARWTPLRSHISGPMPDSQRIRVDGAAGVLAVHLSALGSRGFVPGPMADFACRRTALSQVIPAARVDAIERQLRRCAGAAERSAVAQAWLARWIVPPGRPGSLELALRRLRSDGELRIASLAAELNLSERSLQRHFARHCGVGPKQLALAVRLRRAVQLSRGAASWTQIAHLSGFSDQAHLNRSFLAVFGQTPGQFRAQHDDVRLQPPEGPNATAGDTAISLSEGARAAMRPMPAVAHASSET